MYWVPCALTESGWMGGAWFGSWCPGTHLRPWCSLWSADFLKWLLNVFLTYDFALSFLQNGTLYLRTKSSIFTMFDVFENLLPVELNPQRLVPKHHEHKRASTKVMRNEACDSFPRRIPNKENYELRDFFRTPNENIMWTLSNLFLRAPTIRARRSRSEQDPTRTEL